MRYKLPTDRLVNQLVPYFLSGRKYVLFLQSLIYPLQVINEWFVKFAKEKQIEARMTSQTMYFEWYLNYKFKEYFANQDNSIYIKDSQTIGVDLYHEFSAYNKPFTVWYQGEQVTIANPEEEPKAFYFIAEEKLINKVSFLVYVPQISIPEQEFIYMLSNVINTYKLAGMTYLIRIDSNEFEPNKKTNIK